MSMRVRKIILWIVVATVLGMVGTCVLLSINAGVHNSRYFPSEQVYVKAVSPDGEKVALFSIKYQSVSHWIPDYEPYTYVTVIETEHGGILLRETEYHGSIEKSFVELAKKYAPWAIEQVTDLGWKSLP